MAKPKNQHWLRMELALLLAEGTGRRIGSIRQLRWEDFDFSAGTVHWRADADKKRVDWTVPLPSALLDEVRRIRVKLGGSFGGFVFPSKTDATRPMPREVFQKALQQAEEHAALPKLDGSLWHAYRRKWASERKHLPVTDVAAAGGWKGTETLLSCYQQPDRETMLAVMSEPRKVSDRAVWDVS
ncbi:MAG: site-specific integrase [Gemmatimonadota bacterium]|nr:site-specific integrase [Gemmatimonadota bacterium]